ncbi:hypothetical protein ACFOSW_30305 [Paenibacillus sp. GCM10012303]
MRKRNNRRLAAVPQNGPGCGGSAFVVQERNGRDDGTSAEE